ncbi:MAG: hypothetical protein HPY68_03345 [Candidatus Atribacteria bacterium]|nr:hypothetical protein [Candidatus Atribacteria bacterium]
MKKLFLLLVVLVIFLAGCSSGSFDPRKEEIRALLNRYGNALIVGNYELAKSCLVPSGPRDDNFDLTFQIIQNIMNAEPQYLQGVCSLPLFGVVIDTVQFQGDWAEVKLKSRQVCGFCENAWVIPYPVPVPEYAYPNAPSVPQNVSPFSQWTCFENFFLIDTDTVLVKKVGDEWLLY